MRSCDDCCWDSTCWPCWKKRSNWEVACGVIQTGDHNSSHSCVKRMNSNMIGMGPVLVISFVYLIVLNFHSTDQWMIAYWKVASCQYGIKVLPMIKHVRYLCHKRVAPSDQRHPATNSASAQSICLITTARSVIPPSLLVLYGQHWLDCRHICNLLFLRELKMTNPCQSPLQQRKITRTDRTII